jgi:hypothetical protein
MTMIWFSLERRRINGFHPNQCRNLLKILWLNIGWEEGNKFGKLGDISDRPNQTDLEIIRKSIGLNVQNLGSVFDVDIVKVAT